MMTISMSVNDGFVFGGESGAIINIYNLQIFIKPSQIIPNHDYLLSFCIELIITLLFVAAVAC